MAPSRRKYKIKLASGRVLGPVDLDRIKQLILKNQLTGSEIAREYPKGDWVPVGAITPIADLFIAHAQGDLSNGMRPELRATQTQRGIFEATTRMLASLLSSPGSPGPG